LRGESPVYSFFEQRCGTVLINVHFKLRNLFLVLIFLKLAKNEGGMMIGRIEKRRKEREKEEGEDNKKKSKRGRRGEGKNKSECSTTGKPTHLFRTKCVSLDSV
jgi:hypothetical protein